jgi:hypothetical protein
MEKSSWQELSCVEGGPGFSPSAGDRVISVEENAQAGFFLTSFGRFFEPAHL